jgi:hypothetical protein
MNNRDIEKIWKQTTTPVVYRSGKGEPLLVRLPYRNGNYEWLRNEKRHKPKLRGDKHKYWEIPKAWFNDVVDRSLDRWESLYIIQPHRQQEKCAPACWNATGHECQCSCLGENHGSQNPEGRWFVVSDTFATRWHNKELACRLLTKQH